MFDSIRHESMLFDRTTRGYTCLCSLTSSNDASSEDTGISSNDDTAVGTSSSDDSVGCRVIRYHNHNHNHKICTKIYDYELKHMESISTYAQ